MDIRKDLHSWLSPSIGAGYAVATADVVGAIIDTQGFNVLEFLFTSGTITSGVFTPLIEASNDPAMAGAVTLSGQDLLGTVSGATFTGVGDSNKIKTIGVVLSVYRYIRPTLVGTSSPNGGVSITNLLSNPNTMYSGSPNPNVSAQDNKNGKNYYYDAD